MLGKTHFSAFHSYGYLRYPKKSSALNRQLAGAMHRVAWALQTAKAIGQKCEKPWENQGFAAERTGTELFPIFPVIFTIGWEILPPSDICRPSLKQATADLVRDRS